MMKKTKLLITDTEYYDSSIERLANEANNTNEYAQRRMSPRELKQRMMLPAKILTEHLNALIMILDGLDERGELSEESILGVVQTGIPSHPNLYKLLIGFKDGSLPSAIKIDNLKTLQTLIDSVSAMLEAYEKGEIGGINVEEISKSIDEIRRWIAELEATKSITTDGVSYELIESRFADKLEELVATKGISVDGSIYMLLEQTVAAISKLWADILANEGLLAGESIKGDEIVGLSGKHLRFTSDEEMEPLNEMLTDYEAGEIGGGGEGVHIGTEPPEDKSLLWVDTDDESGSTGMYILADDETIEDAPEDAEVVIDPDGTPDHFVLSINGIKPDANGNINLPIYNGEVASV